MKRILKLLAIVMCVAMLGTNQIYAQTRKKAISTKNAATKAPAPAASNTAATRQPIAVPANRPAASQVAAPAPTRSSSTTVGRSRKGPSAKVPRNPLRPDPRVQASKVEPPKNGIPRPNYVPGRPVTPPKREYRLLSHKAPRPVIPSNYIMRKDAAYIGNILGLAFRTSIASGLTQLYDNNYYIDGYDDNTIYLRDVTMLDMQWEDVAVNYVSGCLDNVQFVASTAYPSENRYNSVYYAMCAAYGDPVMLNYASSSPVGTAAWFGRGGESYATLEYFADTASGQRRYYTVLTYSTYSKSR